MHDPQFELRDAPADVPTLSDLDTDDDEAMAGALDVLATAAAPDATADGMASR